jgi:uncharacterized protein YbjQ (UPF0145 family)
MARRRSRKALCVTTAEDRDHTLVAIDGRQSQRPLLNYAEPASHQTKPTRQEADLIVVTTENVTGHRTVRMLGQCFGVVVRSRGLGGNLMAGLRSIVGGEIHEYTQMLEEARRHALDRLVHNATAMGANAILMMRFDSAEIGNTMSEIVAYGTAAVIEPG